MGPRRQEESESAGFHTPGQVCSLGFEREGFHIPDRACSSVRWASGLRPREPGSPAEHRAECFERPFDHWRNKNRHDASTASAEHPDTLAGSPPGCPDHQTREPAEPHTGNPENGRRHPGNNPGVSVFPGRAKSYGSASLGPTYPYLEGDYTTPSLKDQTRTVPAATAQL
jgi:hypothetical protein